MLRKRRVDRTKKTGRTAGRIAKRQPLFSHYAAFETLEDRRLLTGNVDFSILGTKLHDVLTTVQGSVVTAINKAPTIPLLGANLGNNSDIAHLLVSQGNELQTQFDAVASDISGSGGSATTQQMVGFVQQELASLAADITGDSQVNTNDVIVTPNIDADGSWRIKLLLHTNETLATAHPQFDIGLGSFMSLSATGTVDLKVGLDYLLQFTFDPTTSAISLESGDLSSLPGHSEFPSTPLAIGLKASLSNNFSVDGRLAGLLHIGAKNDGSEFNGTFGLNIVSPGQVDATLSATAQIGLKNLTLDFGVADNLPFNPRLTSDGFHLKWSLASTSLTAGLDSNTFGDLSEIGFDQIYIDAGAFFGGYVSDVVKNVQHFTKPLQPLVDILSTEIPGLSDLGLHVSLRTLLGVSGTGYDNALDAITAINHIDADSLGGTAAMIPLGSFTIDGDLRRGAGSIATSSVSPDIMQHAQDDAGATLDQVGTSNAAGMKFPILTDPLHTVFPMLLGQDATLFSFAMPPLTLPLSVEIPLLAIPPFAGLFLDASVAFSFRMNVGYDTFGVREFVEDATNGVSDDTKLASDILDGFYIDNTKDHDGHYATGVEVVGGLALAGKAVIVKVSGGLFADVSLHMDPALEDDQHHVRLASLVDQLSNGSLPFATSGSIYVAAELQLVIPTFWKDIVLADVELAHITLIDFDGETSKTPHTDGSTIFIHKSAEDEKISVRMAQIKDADIYNPLGLPPPDPKAYTDAIEVSYPDRKELFPVAYHPSNGPVVDLAHYKLIATDQDVDAFGFPAEESGNQTISVGDLVGDGEGTPLNAVLIGGSGNDILEYQGRGKAVLIGAGGNNKLRAFNTSAQRVDEFGSTIDPALFNVNSIDFPLTSTDRWGATVRDRIQAEVAVPGPSPHTSNIMAGAGAEVLLAGGGWDNFIEGGSVATFVGGAGNNEFKVEAKLADPNAPLLPGKIIANPAGTNSIIVDRNGVRGAANDSVMLSAQSGGIHITGNLTDLTVNNTETLAINMAGGTLEVGDLSSVGSVHILVNRGSSSAPATHTIVDTPSAGLQSPLYLSKRGPVDPAQNPNLYSLNVLQGADGNQPGASLEMLAFTGADDVTVKLHGGQVNVADVTGTGIGLITIDGSVRPTNSTAVNDVSIATHPGISSLGPGAQQSAVVRIEDSSTPYDVVVADNRSQDITTLLVPTQDLSKAMTADASSMKGTLRAYVGGATFKLNQVNKNMTVFVVGTDPANRAEVTVGDGTLAHIQSNVSVTGSELTIDNSSNTAPNIFTMTSGAFTGWSIPGSSFTPTIFLGNDLSPLVGNLTLLSAAGDQFDIEGTPAHISKLVIENATAMRNSVFVVAATSEMLIDGDFNLYLGRRLRPDGTVERTKRLTPISNVKITFHFNTLIGGGADTIFDGDLEAPDANYTIDTPKPRELDPHLVDKADFLRIRNLTLGIELTIGGYRAADTLYVYMPGATVDADLHKTGPGNIYFDGNARLTGTNPTSPNDITVHTRPGVITMTPAGTNNSKLDLLNSQREVFNTVYVLGALSQDSLHVITPTTVEMASSAIGSNQTRFDYAFDGVVGESAFVLPDPVSHYTILSVLPVAPITNQVDRAILTSDWPADEMADTFTELESTVEDVAFHIDYGFFVPQGGADFTLSRRVYPLNANPIATDNIVTVDASQLRGSFSFQASEPNYATPAALAEALDRFGGAPVTNFGQTYVTISKTNPQLTTTITGTVPVSSDHFNQLVPFVDGHVSRWAGTQVAVGTGDLTTIEGSVAVNEAWLRDVDDRNSTQPNIVTVGADATTWTSASGAHPALGYANLQGKLTISGSPLDQFSVEGTPSSAYKTIIQNFSTTATPAGVYVMGKNVMPLEVTGNFNLSVGRHLNSDGTVTATGSLGAFNEQSHFAQTGGNISGAPYGQLWQDFRLIQGDSTIVTPVTYNSSYVFGGFQSPLPIFYNYTGSAQATFVFDMSADTVTDRVLGNLGGFSSDLNGISTNVNYPGKAELRYYQSSVVYGPSTEVYYYGPKIRSNSSAIDASLPTLLDNPFTSPVHYFANPSNSSFTPIEPVFIGNTIGPVTVAGSGRTTRVEINPLFSLPVKGDLSLFLAVGDPFVRYSSFPGWGAGHTGGFSLIDTLRADVTVSNSALRVIGDIPLPAGASPPTSRPNVTVTGDHLAGIAGATIHFANLVDSNFGGNGFNSSFDLNRNEFPGLSIQLPAQVSTGATLENTPSGATTQITTVLSANDSAFTDGTLNVLAIAGPLVLGQLYGANNSDRFSWNAATGQPLGSLAWSDGISVSQITIGNNGSLSGILGPILLKGDSHFNSATVTTIDGHGDGARSNVSFTLPDYSVPPISTQDFGTIYQQLDGFTAQPIYFGSIYQQPHALNVLGSPGSTYDVASAPITMKLYAGVGSTVTAHWPSLSIIGAWTVHMALDSFYSAALFPSVPEVSVEQDPAHPHVIDLQMDAPQFNANVPIRLDNIGNGQFRLAKTNAGNNPDSWRVRYVGTDTHLTLNYGTLTINDTGAAGTVAGAEAGPISVAGTTGLLQITGNPFVTLGANGSTQNILGNVEITPTSAMSVNLDDRNDTGHRDVHLLTDVDGSTFITGLSPGSVRAFTELVSVTVDGSAGGTTFHVDSKLDPVTSHFFSINGHSTSDLVIGPNQANTWWLFNSTIAFLNTNVVLNNIWNLQGGKQHDAFSIRNGSTTAFALSGNLDGDDGVDSLYYQSGIPGSDAVDFPNHHAPLIAGQVFNLEQSGVFASLVLGNIGPQSVQVSVPLVPLAMTASFGFGDKRFSATGLPAGIAIDPLTGVISGTTTVENFSGFVIVTASDDSGNASIGFTFTTLPGLSISPIPNQTSGVDTAVTLSPQTSNIFATTLTYSASGLPTGVSIDPQTGVMSGTIPDGAQSNSPYHVSVTATDNVHTTTVSFTWNVVKALTIVNPGDQTTPETVPMHLQIQVANAVGPVTFSASNLPSYLSIDSATGLITGSIANYWYFYHQNFTFNVTVTATDSQQSVSTQFIWKTLPGFFPSGTDNRANFVGDSVFFSVFASDPYNGGSFTYDVTNLPPGIVWDPATSTVHGTLDSFADTHSPYHPVVTFHNTVFNYSYPIGFDWTVSPAIVLATPGDQSSAVGDAVDVTIPVVRDLGQPITFSANGLPLGLTIDPDTGHITGTVGPQTSIPNTNTVVVSAYDGVSFTSVQFQWQVQSPAANVVVLADLVHGGTVTVRSPAGTTLSASLADAGGFAPPGADFASGLLSLSVTGVLGGAADVTITPSSNQAWDSFFLYGATPSEPDGWYQFLYQNQTDHNDASTTGAEFLPNGQIVLHLRDKERGDSDLSGLDGVVSVSAGGPVLTHLAIIDPGTLSVLVGDVINQPLQTVFARGSVTFSASGLPNGLSIDPHTGQITGTIRPIESYPAEIDSLISATDGVTSTTLPMAWYVTPRLSNVVVVPHPSGTGFIQLTAPEGTSFFYASISATSGVDPLPGYGFPVGYFTFALFTSTPGDAVDITISGIDTTDVTDYYRFGPTPDNFSGHWYDFLLGPQSGGTGMEIVNGNVVLHLKDGARGDDDLLTNGIIYDVGGPAVAQTVDTGTTTTLTSNHIAGATYGDQLHFTAIVSSAAGTATGSVQFKIDGQNVGAPHVLSGGVASLDIPVLSAADHAIAAIYSSDDPAFTDSEGDFTQHIDPAALTIIAVNKSKVYGALLPALTFDFSGFVNNETAAILDTLPALQTTATATSHFGNYPITVGGSSAANYTIHYQSGSLSVTPAALTITADGKTKAYGAALPALTASYSGLVNGDTPASLTTAPTLSTTATAASHVNSYPITIGGAVDSDYTISYQAGSLSVSPVALTIKADNKSKIYGAALPALTASFTGLVNGDTPASLTTAPALSTTATAASHVNSYPISASGAVDSDYTISYQAGSLSVTPVALTITADGKTKPYGAALPTLTASYAGFVNGDTPASLTTAPTLSTTATAASHVNSYPISASGAVDSDYTISYQAGSLSVTPVALTITADGKTKPYGAALPTLTASYLGFVNGDTPTSLATQPHLSTTGTAASHVNSYPITAIGAVDPDYTIGYQAGSLSVTPVALTIKADDKTKVYSSALPALTASYTGLVNGDTPSSLTTAPAVSTTATAASHVNSYPITASGAVDADYTISYQAGSLSVTPATLTIKADTKSKIYGAVLPTLTASYTGLVNGDTPASLTTAPTLSTTGTSASHVGDYPITAGGAVDADYTIAYVPDILHVTPAALTITAADKTKPFGAALPTLTASYSGFVNGDSAANLTTLPTLSTTATAASTVGDYPITASGAVDPDYTFAYFPGVLHVTPVSVATTTTILSNHPTSATYGQLLHFTVTVSAASGVPTGSLQFKIDGQNVGSPVTLSGGQAGFDAPILSAIDHAIVAIYSSDDSAFVSSQGNLTQQVDRAPLTITAANKSKVYGAALPALAANYSGFVNGESPANLSTPPTLATTATAASHVGNYAIIASGAAAANYTISYQAGSLGVTSAALSIKPDNKSKVYGAATVALSASYTGFVNGDTAANLATQPTLATTASAASHVGNYPITATGAVDVDYTISYQAGSFAVTPAALTIKTDNKSKLYGAALPALTASYAGFVNGDTPASLATTATLSTTATAASHVNSYPITAGGAVDSDYTISYQAGSLSVTPVALTITADGKTKLYGAAVPTLTASYLGFVNGDTAASLTTQPHFTTTATAASAVATYPITPNGAVDADYSIGYLPGSLNVTPAPLTIKADDKSKVAGAANPPLTFTPTGLVNGDTAASLTKQPTLTTTATASSPSGQYPITASGATSANYTISYASGTMTVTAAVGGSITGKEYLDVTGNGLTSDDTPLAGVKVYLDSNNNGSWNTGEPFATTLADGSYALTGLAAGTYKVREVVPIGSIRTAPVSSDVYSVTLAGGQTSSGNNFANAALGNVSVLANVVYLINGVAPLSDLRGATHEGDTIAVSFTVAAGAQPQRFTFVSYTAPGAKYDANTAAQQRVFDSDTGVFGPGTYTLSISNPHSYFQVDFVSGSVIDHLGPANSNIFYTSQNRLFSADNGGTHAVLASPAVLTGSVYRDDNNNGLIESGELPLAGVKVTATAGSTTQTVVTDLYGVYLFDNLPAGSYTITETQPGDYTDGKETLGNKGGTVANDKFSGIVLTAGSSASGYNFGEQRTIGSAVAGNQTQTIAWWNGSTGQALIKALNGNPSAKNLGNWLAANFNNLFGADAGSANNLAGKTNAQVAAYYQSLFSNAAKKAEAQTFSLALAVYVTNSSLAGTTGTSYGFAVSAGGLGVATASVGMYGAAFGVNNNAIVTIAELLARSNARSRKGSVWDASGDGALNAAESLLRNQTTSLFDSINNL